MLFLLVTALAIAVALARGGSLTALAGVSIRCWWLLPLALVGRFSPLVPFLRSLLPREIVPGFLTVGSLLYELSLLTILGLLVANRHLPGMPLVILGWLLNFAVVVANGGHMPIAAELLPSAASASGQWMRLTVLTPSAPLGFLSDVIVLSLPVLEPGAISVGDIFVAAGGFLFFQGVMHRPRSSRAA